MEQIHKNRTTTDRTADEIPEEVPEVDATDVLERADEILAEIDALERAMIDAEPLSSIMADLVRMNRPTKVGGPSTTLGTTSTSRAWTMGGSVD